MADRSAIEWTDATWNPIRARNLATGKVGWHCEHASEGCRNCYAETFNEKRLGTGLPFKPGHRGDVEIFLDEKTLLAPLRWRRPRRIFVGSMTDLFGAFVPDEMIDKIFAVMALCPQHTFQVLTKRPARMRKYLTTAHRPGQFRTILDDGTAIDTPGAHVRTHSAMCDLLPKAPAQALNDACAWQDRKHPGGDGLLRAWPLPNVWLGTSCEDQATADARVPELLATPAAIRFVSAEPLLGPIDFRRWLLGEEDHGVDISREVGARVGACVGWTPPLDWIIAGGESGPRARPMHPAWARSIRDQCAAAEVAFHFKQHGEWLFEDQICDGQHPGERFFTADGKPVDDKPPFGSATGKLWHWWDEGAFASIRLGKARAGRLLDGVEHNGIPEVRA